MSDDDDGVLAENFFVAIHTDEEEFLPHVVIGIPSPEEEIPSGEPGVLITHIDPDEAIALGEALVSMGAHCLEIYGQMEGKTLEARKEIVDLYLALADEAPD